ncbi:MAG: cytochrome c [Nitrospinae bacterium]|nr:cytochrome c [Nitrospinota bacterium]MZH06084.1 cytochrome c [Nitrospinota bacterium]MZH15152.1 cytochrome c [Nitrospinota bacterium]
MTQTIPEPESHGAKLYLKKCTQCHGLPGPKRHTPEQWDQLLVLMSGFMKERGLPFSADEKKLIQDYLHRNAR